MSSYMALLPWSLSIPNQKQHLQSLVFLKRWCCPCSSIGVFDGSLIWAETLLWDVTVSTRSRNEWATEAIEPGACRWTERSMQASGGKSQVQSQKCSHRFLPHPCSNAACLNYRLCIWIAAFRKWRCCTQNREDFHVLNPEVPAFVQTKTLNRQTFMPIFQWLYLLFLGLDIKVNTVISVPLFFVSQTKTQNTLDQEVHTRLHAVDISWLHTNQYRFSSW